MENLQREEEIDRERERAIGGVAAIGGGFRIASGAARGTKERCRVQRGWMLQQEQQPPQHEFSRFTKSAAL